MLDATAVATLQPGDLSFGSATASVPNNVSGAILIALLERPGLAPADAYYLFADVIARISAGQSLVLQGERDLALATFADAVALDDALAFALVGNELAAERAIEIAVQIELAALSADPALLTNEYAPFIDVNAPVSSAFTNARGELWRFQADSSREILFIANNEAFSSTFQELWLDIYNASFDLIASNSGEAFPDAALRFEVAAGETYYIWVVGFGEAELNYSLLLFDEDEPAPISTLARAGIALQALGAGASGNGLLSTAVNNEADSLAEQFATGTLLLPTNFAPEATAMLEAVLQHPDLAELTTDHLVEAMYGIAVWAEPTLSQQYLDLLVSREDLLDIEPDRLGTLAISLAELGLVPGAIVLFDAADRFIPRTAQAYAYFGQLLLENNFTEDALRYLTVVAEPDTLATLPAETIVDLARVTSANELSELTVLFSQEALGRGNLAPVQQGQLALVLLQQSKTEEFRQAFDDLLTSQAVAPSDLAALAVEYQESGFSAEADQLLDQALANGVSFGWEDLIMAGISLEVNGQSEAANRFYAVVLADTARTEADLLQTATELTVSGLTDSAAQFYDASLNNVSENRDAYRSYLACYTGILADAREQVAVLCDEAATLAQPIVFEQLVTGFVAPEGGDAWSFSGRAGQQIQITMFGDDGFDTYLTLLGPDDIYITENDDSDGTNSAIVVTLAEDGVYIILAHGFADSSGSYELYVEALID